MIRTRVQVVSKIGSNPQSGFVLVKQSPSKNVDFVGWRTWNAGITF